MARQKPPKRTPKGDHEVGYCRPPRSGQIKKGEVRNPRGRGARKPPALEELIEAELGRHIKITEDGVTRRATLLQVMVKRLAAMAVSGDHRALKLILSLRPARSASSDEFSELPPLVASEEDILKWIGEEFGGETAQ